MAQCVGVEVGGKAWVLILGHEGDGWGVCVTQFWSRAGFSTAEKIEEK